MVANDRRNHATCAEACRVVWNALRSGQGSNQRLGSELGILAPQVAERIVKRLALRGLVRMAPHGWAPAAVNPVPLQPL